MVAVGHLGDAELRDFGTEGRDAPGRIEGLGVEQPPRRGERHDRPPHGPRGVEVPGRTELVAGVGLDRGEDGARSEGRGGSDEVGGHVRVERRAPLGHRGMCAPVVAVVLRARERHPETRERRAEQRGRVGVDGRADGEFERHSPVDEEGGSHAIGEPGGGQHGDEGSHRVPGDHDPVDLEVVEDVGEVGDVGAQPVRPRQVATGRATAEVGRDESDAVEARRDLRQASAFEVMPCTASTVSGASRSPHSRTASSPPSTRTEVRRTGTVTELSIRRPSPSRCP